MTDPTRDGAALTRRRLLINAAASAAFPPLDAIAKPFISFAASRPVITHGIQSGDVSMIRASSGRAPTGPPRMLVEVSTTDSSRRPQRRSADALPERISPRRHCSKACPAGRTSSTASHSDSFSPTFTGEPKVGHFRTAPAERRSVSFGWSGDTAGQGWGIDESRGGMRTFATMLKNRPDFFIHSGDSIYADCPIAELAEAAERRNLAQHRDRGEIQGRRDAHRVPRQLQIQSARPQLRAFNAEVPIFAQWDDHEVTNDWVPGERVPWNGIPKRDICKLARAEIAPFANTCRCESWTSSAASIARSLMVRCSTSSCSTCGPTAAERSSEQRQAGILGAATAWLKRELKELAVRPGR